MWHSIEKVALNRRLDKEKFVKFAKDSILKENNKYKLSPEYNDIFVQTFFCDQLVDDFKILEDSLALTTAQSD